MNNLICVNCETQLHPSRMGLILVLHADFGPSTVWKADELRCPGCGTRIISTVTLTPLAEYWQQKQFESVMATVRKVPHNVVHCYENPRGNTEPLSSSTPQQEETKPDGGSDA